jgi:thioredoxin-like negative regulator of GroEL
MKFPTPGKGEDIQAASAAAKSSGKTLLVIVVSPACRLSESFLGSLGTPEVKAALGDRFVVQRLDMANWPGLTARYGVTGVPAVVAVKPDGVVKGRAQGRELMEVKKFLAFLAKAAE